MSIVNSFLKNYITLSECKYCLQNLNKIIYFDFKYLINKRMDI